MVSFSVIVILSGKIKFRIFLLIFIFHKSDYIELLSKATCTQHDSAAITLIYIALYLEIKHE